MTRTPDTPERPSDKRAAPARRGRFWLLAGLALLVLIPAILLSAVLLLLRSGPGTAWLIDQVPGLQAEGDRGSLIGQWQADRVAWRGYGVEVIVREPRVDWSPSCLFRKLLCVDELAAGHIAVTQLPPAEPSGPGGAVTLPGVDLPLGLRIDGVRLGPFTFNGSRVWDRLELDAGGSGADWRIDRLWYRLDGYTVSASGRVETRRDWPVNLEVSASLPPPVGDQWTLDLQLTGSVRDLRVAGHSRGYLDAQLAGSVKPLEPALPAQLKVTSEQFRALGSLPDTLVLHDWFVEAGGSLASGFRTRGEARLSGTAGPVQLSLEGVVTTRNARDIRIELIPEPSGDDARGAKEAGDEQAGIGQNRVVATGKVGWSEGLEAEARVRLRGFPWYTLVPGVAPPPVTLQSLSGDLSWHDGRYQADLTAQVDGPQGVAELDARVNGDMQQIELTSLAVSSGAGSLTGSGSADLSGLLSWQATLALENFNPGFWVPVLQASLDGNVSTEGRLREQGIPDMRASWQLDGQWRSSDAALTGALDTASGSWVLSGLALSIGENRIQGEGTWGDVLRGDLALSLPTPELLLPSLGGSLTAKVQVAGTPDNPTGTVTARAQELRWQDQLEIENLDLDARLDAAQRLDGKLVADNLQGFGQTLDTLAVAVTGTREQHAISLRTTHPEASVELDFTGGVGSRWQTWRGQLANGVITVPEQSQQWRLQAPAALAYGENGRLTFGNHCWRWQQSAVCAEDQTLWPVPRIAYRIERFPAMALAPLLPETLAWKGLINGEIDFTSTAKGPSGRIFLDAGSGEFRLLVDGDWQTLAYNTFTTELDLRPRQADLAVRLSGPELGEFDLDMAVDPNAPDRNVEGRFRIEGLDVALAGQLSTLDEVAGRIDGQGRLSGPLLKPAVTGELHLTNGRIADPELPVPIEELTASVRFSGYSAEISARIQSNERSTTIVDGNVDWRQAPRGEITVTGNRVPFHLEPYARLEIAPDLTIVFKDGTLRVSGKVAVPRGTIEIEALPPQAVSVSEDEVIVGVEREEPLVRNLNMDVRVVVGEDLVKFSAFGVTGHLKGSLRIGDNLDTRGTLRLVNGSYEAYGQELELRRARLLFVGNLTQPYLDIEAVREVGTVVAGIRLTGPVQSPETQVFSTPDMPQTDALSYVILGRAPQTRGDEGQMSRAALSLGLTQASKFTGQIGEEFGIRQLTLEAEGSGEQTSVVASGYLTDELSVRYGVGIFEPITTIALRYDLGKYFYLEAASGLAASLDIFYTRDF